MRKLLALSLLLVFCLGVGPSTNRVYPAAGTFSIVHVHADAASPASKECVKFDLTTGIVCTNDGSVVRAHRDMVVTSWGIALEGTLTTTEACDVGLEVNTDEVGLFQVGSAALDAPGNTEVGNVGANIDAGQVLQITIDEPTDATYCADGVGCTCLNASMSMTIWVNFLTR